MYITLETDYAIRIVDTLAKAKTRMSAQSISDESGVTLRFSLKILSKLVRDGIVRSYKGALGGYELNRKPSEISLNDILEAIEGKYMFSRCLSERHICHRSENRGICEYHNFFDALSEEIAEKLKAATLDNFINN